MLKAFPWKTIAVLRKRFTRGPKGVMSYPPAPARGWELSLVSGFKLERNGEIHTVTEFPLCPLCKSFSVLSGLGLLLRPLIR